MMDLTRQKKRAENKAETEPEFDAPGSEEFGGRR